MQTLVYRHGMNNKTGEGQSVSSTHVRNRSPFVPYLCYVEAFSTFAICVDE